MKTKTLLIAVIKKGDSILMRKKPDGSLPYKETWYLFGTEDVGSKPIEETLKSWVKSQTGIEIKLLEYLGQAKETKIDTDGEKKCFVYKNWSCGYVTGDLKPAIGIEKLEWIPGTELRKYDVVPPSKVLFKQLGYLEN